MVVQQVESPDVEQFEITSKLLLNLRSVEFHVEIADAVAEMSEEEVWMKEQ